MASAFITVAHTDIIGGGPVNAGGGGISAAPDIASTNHNGNLHTQIIDSFDFAGDASHHFSIDAESFARAKRLTAQLEQYSRINQG
jgi:hypothetical protein